MSSSTVSSLSFPVSAIASAPRLSDGGEGDASRLRAHELAPLIALFDGLFAQSFNTILRCDPHEPLYLPAGQRGEVASKCDENDESEVGGCLADELHYHRLYLARGYFSSALHEISHWCIAGPARRLQEDYGYWYAPDGRDALQQKAFESVEVAPQALEQLFHQAVGKPFHVSVDNLELDVDRDAFAQRVAQRAARYQRDGLPSRAAAFYRALEDVWQRGVSQAIAIQSAMLLLPPLGVDGRCG